ncbi:hypothetical protein EV421DRAFT_1744476 [Armillaria borealis]|uniref:Uncharacterized protein n=1 Tax=Armillaria borealis TaxID=47425 RepID=A0AA39IV39_9AGAR|nr:hypothetical protein EV421DRAFT_1744476 [Armillaria borealis]
MAPAKELSMRELYTSALPLSLIYAQFTCEKRDAARQLCERGHGKLDQRMFGVNEWCRVEETLPMLKNREQFIILSSFPARLNTLIVWAVFPWRAEAELSSSNRRRPGERRASNIASLFQSFYDFRALVQHRCLNIRKSAPPKTTRRKMLIYTWSLGRIHRDDKGDGTPTSGDQASGGTKKSSRRMESETFDGQKNSTSLPRGSILRLNPLRPETSNAVTQLSSQAHIVTLGYDSVAITNRVVAHASSPARLDPFWNVYRLFQSHHARSTNGCLESWALHRFGDIAIPPVTCKKNILEYHDKGQRYNAAKRRRRRAEQLSGGPLQLQLFYGIPLFTCFPRFSPPSTFRKVTVGHPSRIVIVDTEARFDTNGS